MVETMSASELRERLATGADLQVVDTRERTEYEAGHIPGAENLPVPELPDRIDERDWHDEVVLVCEKGISSLQAGRILESYEGVDDDATVANLEGGYEAWDGDLVAEE
jgi:thiosulfate/3-mercaptopyruvate sulfurtransferase